ncbi:MAG: FliH/SctL family protein [Planctomycetota bacterium]
MTTTAVPLTARLIGLRLHARRGPSGETVPPAARVLLDLGQRNRQRELDEKKLRDLVAHAEQQLAALPAIVNERLDAVSQVAVELGLSIARELVASALESGQVDPTDTVARCLRDCVHGSDRGDLTVRLNPEDLEQVEQRLVGMPELAEQIAEAKFVADATVPRGGVNAETGAGRLRYDPREVLERICNEVRREAGA